MLNKLREIRKARGMTQIQLAHNTGINRVTIARYETAKIWPTLRNAEKLADALGVTINVLLGKEASA